MESGTLSPVWMWHMQLMIPAEWQWNVWQQNHKIYKKIFFSRRFPSPPVKVAFLWAWTLVIRWWPWGEHVYLSHTNTERGLTLYTTHSFKCGCSTFGALLFICCRCCLHHNLNGCRSASLWPDIPLAATRCKPKLWSFSTKFRLNMFRLSPTSADKSLSVHLSLKPGGAALCLYFSLYWGWGDADIPRSCRSCRSPSDEVVTCAEVLVMLSTSGSTCWCWDGEEELRSSQLRQGGRLKERRLSRVDKRKLA